MQKQIVKTFESTLFGSLHTFTDDKGAPWFVGRQVAEKLGYHMGKENISYTFKSKCPDRGNVSERLSNLLNVLPKGVRKNSVVISEADLFRLVMSSQLTEAEAFQDWVVREVLPSIRNHGGYHAEQPDMASQYADPELFAQMNANMASFGLAMAEFSMNAANLAVTVVNQGQKIEDLASAINAMKTTAPDEDSVPEGYMPISRAWAVIKTRNNGCMNFNAFSRMMESASWPTVVFRKYNKDGKLVPVPHLKPYHSYKGQMVTPEKLMNIVMSEAIQETEHKFSHPLMGTYLQ